MADSFRVGNHLVQNVNRQAGETESRPLLRVSFICYPRQEKMSIGENSAKEKGQSQRTLPAAHFGREIFIHPGLESFRPMMSIVKERGTGDRPCKGTFISGFATSGKKNERAWRGDVSGHAIRARPPKVSQNPGQADFSNYLTNSSSGRGRGSRPIPVRYPGKGVSMLGKFFRRFGGVQEIPKRRR